MKIRGGEHLLKTAWHLGLAAAAAFEWANAETRFRRLLAAACTGWHLEAAHDDWKDFRNARRYRQET
jgi:hypothetical protein